MSELAWRVVTGVLILALLYVLVRPSSKAGDVIVNVTDAFSKLVNAAVQ